ncbi:MAG: DUF4190 domain-containing protein [Firmicutes bacterium]|nr:DUF4190 domain-containing protein [Bacillota bacterium]
MECKNCGTSNQDNAKFCAGCGADLSLQNAGEGLDEKAQEQVLYTVPQQEQTYTQNYNQAPNYQNQNQNQNYNYNQGQPQGYGYNAAPVAASDPGKGMAIAAMVLGIVSFFCFPAITGALGIIFGCVAKGKGSRSGMALAGIICGAIGIALWLLMLILGFSFMPF